MMRRPITMQPLGNMQGVVKPQRVSSSTCPKPQLSIDGVQGGQADEFINEAGYKLTGAEHWVMHALEQGNITYDESLVALQEMWE